MKINAKSTFPAYMIFFTVVSLFLSGFLYSQQAAHRITYAEALSIAFQKSPDIRSSAADVEKARGQKITARQIFPANPELEATMSYGVRKISPLPSFSPSALAGGGNPIDASPNKIFGQDKQNIKGYEFLLNIPIEIAGKKCLERKIAGTAMDRAIIGLNRAKLNLRSSVRTNMITLSSMERQNKDIAARMGHLREIWKKKGSNFIDSKLGPYAGRVFMNDMLEMESDRQQMEQAGSSAKNVLCGLLVIPDGQDFLVDNPENIPLPDIPDNQVLVNDAIQSSFELKDTETALAMAKDGLKLAKRISVPDPTLFFGFGRQIVGSAGPFGPEREDEQIGRFGIRIPLPVNSTGGERISAQADIDKAESDIARLKHTLGSSVRTTAALYRQLRSSLEQLRYGVRHTAETLNQIDQAFMFGRISYFDFWSEYDRSNRFIRRYNDTLIATSTVLGQLEMLIGHTLDKE